MAKTRRDLLKSLSKPRTSGRFRGVSIGRDSDGYYVATHRSRSKSYLSKRKIPDSIIKRVAATG